MSGSVVSSSDSRSRGTRRRRLKDEDLVIKAFERALLGRPLRSDEPVFVVQRGGPIRDNKLAERYREELKRAGITRPELYEQNAERRRIVLHSTRSAFITVNLASGMPEMKISDRTGHKDSSQIAR